MAIVMWSKLPGQPTCDTSETLLWTGEGRDTSHSLSLLKREEILPLSVFAIHKLKEIKLYLPLKNNQNDENYDGDG